jgi:hypothetical protein
MGKGNVILLVLILVFAALSALAIFRPNNLTAFLINDSNSTSHTIIPYAVVIITLVLVIVYVTKLFFLQNITTNSMRPAEALESLLLDFEMARSKGDPAMAKSIAQKARHLFDHLVEDQKPFFKSRVNAMEKYIN